MSISKRRLLQSAAALAIPAAALNALATGVSPTVIGINPGGWPSKPIRLLVGFPRESAPDIAARLIATPLSALLGQQVLVENKPGASGNIAADEVAKARDDHTIGVLINGNMTIAKLLNPSMPFDPETDFSPVGLVGTAPLVFVTSARAAGNSPEELLLWIREINTNGRYGTPGSGTVGHLGMELLKMHAGIFAKHEAFNSNPQVVEALLAEKIHMALLPPGLALPHVRSGKLKVVAVTSPERSPLAEGVPTLREIGVHGAEIEIWTALAGPASMPEAASTKLNAALTKVLKSPAVAETLIKSGWQPRAGAQIDLARRIRKDTNRLGGVIIVRGIKEG
ncbi:tripartite-type tricarboxylate transporter receptor subunit TctC [Variovorax boronicumulans]|uniref:Tripartite-type tricarboxylate transporter receptor subunit TctC n=1 Tax=Variovorax boronicumulans TaxID=436515 RepID=A0AAW8D4S4_9BURK|nr:tripartite tricarboxylate transporter substrate binding protein [Variovorax boronicumulans]MDP9897412.1 tripartite-type tricarboxylate transporter receptor subunit TctC [Variovorax boronicumulans]MDQ0057446.1 tripartite-type tricarboxylate transporter receptor subunit TctC [Variovorax boronicumulans]